MNIKKGLIIDEPWISKILSGEKVWEMRSTSVSNRGWIALVRKGSGQVVGVANLAGVSGPHDVDNLKKSEDKHCIGPDLYKDPSYKWWYAWILEDAMALLKPVPYVHPNGAVIWVKLDSDAVAGIADQLQSRPVQDVNYIAGDIQTERVAEDNDSSSHSREILNPGNTQATEIRITLTQGNINNSHFYIPRQTELFPKEAWGGKNKSEAGVSVEWDIDGLDYSVHSDIDGTKRILRNRGAVKDFFKLHGLKTGDEIKISKIDENKFRISVC